MSGKGLNVFDKCATSVPSRRILYLFFLREKESMHTWHLSKITQDTTKKNTNGAIAKTNILVEQVIL